MSEERCPLVDIGRYVLTSDAAKGELAIPCDLFLPLEQTLGAEDGIKLRGGAIAAGDDKDGVRVRLAESEVDGSHIALIAEFVVQEDHIEGALVVNYVVGALLN